VKQVQRTTRDNPPKAAPAIRRPATLAGNFAADLLQMQREVGMRFNL